jgi:hypothetical protein
MSKDQKKPQWVILDDSVLQDNPSNPSNSNLQNPLLMSSKMSGTNSISVRNAISDLYDGFIMTKTHDVQGYGIYKAVVDSMSGNDSIKYVVAIVPSDSDVYIGSQIYLSTLPWVSFQTRVTTKPKHEFSGFTLHPQKYSIKRDSILMDKIKIASEQDTKHIYIPDHLPLRIEILIQKEGESFAQEGIVVSALELFQTVLVLEEQNY